MLSSVISPFPEQIVLFKRERAFSQYLARQLIPNPRQFTIDVDDIRRHDPDLAQDLIVAPCHYFHIAKQFLKRIEIPRSRSIRNKRQGSYQIRMVGQFGPNCISQRELNCSFLNELVQLTGIVSRIEIPRNQLVESVHFVAKTQSYFVKQYANCFDPCEQFRVQANNHIPKVDKD